MVKIMLNVLMHTWLEFKKNIFELIVVFSPQKTIHIFDNTLE